MCVLQVMDEKRKEVKEDYIVIDLELVEVESYRGCVCEGKWKWKYQEQEQGREFSRI